MRRCLSSDESFLPHLVLSLTFIFDATYLSSGKKIHLRLALRSTSRLQFECASKYVPSVTDRDSSSARVILALLPKGAKKPALPLSGSVS